jgi:putative heme iron utilization protein
MARLSKKELKQYLDEKAAQYESPEFLETDPLGVVHRADSKQDKEILGLLTALIAWGNRKSIINNAEKIFEILEGQPHHFLLEHTSDEIERLTKGICSSNL